jgi:methyl-accepting chemotaxis protein
MTDAVKAVTKGNLTQKADIPSKDEIGELAEYYNISVERLKETITSLSKVSLVLSNMAEVLDGAIKQMLLGVEQNAMQANSVAAASEEMSATSSEIAQNCMLAAKGSETANQAAISGESITKDTIDSKARQNEFVSYLQGLHRAWRESDNREVIN